MAKIVLIASFVFLVYTYIGYAVLAWLLALALNRKHVRRPWHPTVSMVLAVYNEEKYLRRKLGNFMEQDYPSGQVEFVIVSDGSSDGTNAIIREFAGREKRCTSCILPERSGKAAALNAGISTAHGDIIVLTDARQMFEPGTLAKLVSNFADEKVGAVSGALQLKRNGDAVGRSFSSYWDLEKWLRRSESRIHSVMGLTGSVCALRRSLYEPIPAGTILDDVMIPMRILKKGFRVIFDDEAVAYDDASIEYGRELKRKIRTLTGNFQLLAMMPDLLSVRRNPFFFQYFSHKVTRLMSPVFMAALFVSNLLITEGIYLWVLAGQSTFYGLACAGILMKDRVKKFPYLSIPRTFIMLNYAVCVGFANFLKKRMDVWV